jgi:signal transduction histidine kinase
MTPGIVSSIKNKLLGVVLLTTLVALLLAMTAMITYDLRLYHRGWLADVSTQAELVASNSSAALTFDDVRSAKENLQLLRNRQGISAAAIYDSRGTLFTSYHRTGEEPDFPKLPEADGAKVSGDDVIVFKRIIDDGKILGTIYVRADYELYDRLVGYVGIALLVMLGALTIAYVLSRKLQAVVTAPILSITGIAREVVEQRDYSRRAEKTTGDEVGILVDSFNGMLDEIERRNAELEASNERMASEAAERARAEEEVRRLNAELEGRVRDRTDQLEAANRELEAFCHTVSHDLRAPLRSIDGFSQALIEDSPKDVSEDGKRYIARIRAATVRMGQLIEDLLNLSKVSRGSMERSPVDVSEVANRVVNVLKMREPERQIEISVWEGMAASGDARLLRAALENLLGNAWKFTSKRTDARIEVGAMRESSRTVFFVRDNGAGFDMAYANKLFGAFQRLHSNNEFSGTGIGLATVQRIVHRHGGKIWADAQVDKGAAFFFTLSGEQHQARESAADGIPS